MEKTYKVTTWRDRFSPFFGFYRDAEEKEMTYREIFEARKMTSDWIISDFRWKDYDKDYRHLVYCVEFESGEFTMYPHGFLMTDREYEEKIVSRMDKDILLVWAYHKNDYLC